MKYTHFDVKIVNLSRSEKSEKLYIKTAIFQTDRAKRFNESSKPSSDFDLLCVNDGSSFSFQGTYNFQDFQKKKFWGTFHPYMFQLVSLGSLHGPDHRMIPASDSI